MPSRLALSTLALSLAHVLSYRQKIMLEREDSALHVVDSISTLLEQRDFAGVESMVQEISRVTPDADGDFKQILEKFTGDIQSGVLKKIEDGHDATQSKIDEMLLKFASASTAAVQGKRIADQVDEELFSCIASLQKQLQAFEQAQKRLADAQSNEAEACQMQQDNAMFSYSADKSSLSFECVLSGNCNEKHQSFRQAVEQIRTEAGSKLAARKAAYSELQAKCTASKEASVDAQSALTAAEEDVSRQRALCTEAELAHSPGLCAFGQAVQSKCAAESAFKALIASTKKVKGDMDSEVDRIQEWVPASTANCILAKKAEQGLSASLGDADLDECVRLAKSSYEKLVGTLDRKEGDFKRLSGSNICATGPISFFNGWKWTLPTKENAKSSEFVREEFEPVLNLHFGQPFAFCQEGGENQGPATLHKIEEDMQCGVDWKWAGTTSVDNIDKVQYTIGASLASWGCDRLNKPSVQQLRLTTTGATYALSYC